MPGNADARQVSLAGSFSDWKPVRMSKRRGRFQASLLLAPGAYQYKFMVDGEWKHDPAAEESVVNEFGTLNSVVRVEAPQVQARPRSPEPRGLSGRRQAKAK